MSRTRCTSCHEGHARTWQNRLCALFCFIIHEPAHNCRYLLRDVMVSMVRAKWKKWDILDAAIEREGWKLLLLLRLSPMVPYNLLNIAMATTKMHFWVFAIVSAIGELLIVCLLLA